MNKRCLGFLSICVLGSCVLTSGSEIVIEKRFSYPYQDKSAQNHSLDLFEISARNGCGPRYILVANELWNQRDFNVISTSNQKCNIGILKTILLDAHPFPAFRSSYHGIPVIIEWGMDTESKCLWLIIGNYGEYICCFVFSKNENGIFAVQSQCQWPFQFIQSPSQKYRLLWNHQAAFLCQVKTSESDFLSGIRLLFNGPEDPITPLMPVIYPYCPSELAFFSSDGEQFECTDLCFKMPSNFIGVKINDKLLEAHKIEKYARRYLHATGGENFSINEIIFSSVIASLMTDVFFPESESVLLEFTYEDVVLFYTRNRLSMPSSMNMDNWNVNNIKRKYAANKFVEKNRTEWLEVSTEERQKLIEKFKTVFCKNFEPNSEPDNLSEYDDFIGEQVMRLKYYGMSQLLDMKLDIKLVWDKTPNAELKRGWFDPLPPEELERRKREFQASQPLKELFSATELEALFAEPDYASITDPLKLARAYDWSGKYPEAVTALEKADGIEAKFELGCFLKHGRPGVKADKKKANELFSEIASTIASGDRTFSPEDYCLAGRACREYVPENWTETTRWKKRASQFFQKAIEQGYRPAYYYSQYYERHSSDCNLAELVKALPSDNPEINAFIATVAATNPHLKQYRDRAQNLAAVKAAIEARSNVAQCALGMLYLAFETTPDAFLRYNPEKARFWLQRAAERGDTDAIQILRNDSRLNMPNQLQKKND